jgi:UDP-N-acetyl-D-galactosamine dehydrogenase
MGIDTEEVLRAAGTKWNFLPFRPGLVGGHCIGVDPYYLTHKAQEIGFHPEMILAGRRVNDNMGPYIARRVIKGMTELRILVAGAKILVMGLAFKENCPDLRNSKVVDVVRELEAFDADVVVYDPWVDADASKLEYGITLVQTPKRNFYDAVVIAVGHNLFRDMGIGKIRSLGKDRHLLFDVKYLFAAKQTDQRL